MCPKYGALTLLRSQLLSDPPNVDIEQRQKWPYDNLKPSGVYCEDFLDESRLDDVLELYRQETASTFGTRRSSRAQLQSAIGNHLSRLRTLLQAPKAQRMYVLYTY